MSYGHIMEHQGQPVFVVLPFADYKQLLAQRESKYKTDQELLDEVLAVEQESFPGELIHSILDGKSAIKAFREYRGLSQEQLAQKICKTKQYISAIENDTRTGTIATLRKIATALDVDLDIIE